VVAAIAAAAIALADNYQYRLTPAGQAAAAKVVLDPSLLPKGWKGGPVKPDLSPNPLRCPDYAPKQSDLVVNGAKESDFTFRTHEIDSYATVFQSPAMVETDVRRGGNINAFFGCIRKVWPTLSKGTKLLSVTRLALPKVTAHSLAYRVVFEDTASKQRIAIDSLNIAHGRYELELDQIVTAPSAAELANMAISDKLFATGLDRELQSIR
jgi:hypothetical protein